MKSSTALLVFAACCVSSWGCLQAQPPAIKDVPASYVLGPNDQVFVDIVELPEVGAKTYRIDADGTIALPFAGRIQAGGRTLKQFEADLTQRIRTQVRNPHITTNLVETRSQPISVVGAVNTPGSQQLAPGKRLFDVIAAAGGLKTEAGDVIKISRRASQGPLNLPGETRDPATGNSIGEVNVRDVVEMRDSGANIELKPYDAISVSPAQVVYVVGDVRKPGGLALSRRRSISALEALSVAEGLLPNAAPKKARILRLVAGNTERQQIPVNLKSILDGKSEDVLLRPDDVLFVPNSSLKRITARTADAALGTVSGLIIWRGF